VAAPPERGLPSTRLESTLANSRPDRRTRDVETHPAAGPGRYERAASRRARPKKQQSRGMSPASAQNPGRPAKVFSSNDTKVLFLFVYESDGRAGSVPPLSSYRFGCRGVAGVCFPKQLGAKLLRPNP